MMQPHPRLAISAERLAALATNPALPMLRAARRKLLKNVEAWSRSAVFDWPPNTHNAHLVRARINQTRVLTLLAAYFATGKRQPRLKQAVLDHVREMARWEYWSWITWRKGDARPDAIYDLSYGENSMTLAVVYDWLHGELTDAERRLVLDQARGRAFKSFLANARDGFWFAKADTNWNTVCAGGAGMLALAVHDELPEAMRVLALAEKSVRPFMELLNATAGGWPEGLGYWNYGMRYAFWFLLSHERATGRLHPLLKLPGVRQSLRFPLDFSPNGIPCGFNDSNGWQPLPFHYAAAVRLICPDVLIDLDCCPRGGPTAGQRHPWPDWGRDPEAELLLMHPGQSSPPVKPARRVAKFYPRMDWAVLADQMPAPNICLALRGGTTTDPHGQCDLLSFHCVAGGEAMVSTLNTAEYLDTTFSPRRNELYDIAAPSKNAIFINGVGVVPGSRVCTSRLEPGGNVRGFRIDATEAMGVMHDGPAAKFCGRAVLMLADKAFLVIDSVLLPHVGRVESRMHTFTRVKFAGSRAELIGRHGNHMQAVYACNVPAGLYRGQALHTTPRSDPATVLRWCAESLHCRVVMATLLCPGRQPPRLELKVGDADLRVRVRARGWSAGVRLGETLLLLTRR